MSEQPIWETVYATDCEALYRDTTGVYPPELVIAQADDDVDADDIEAIAAHVYRFPLDRLYQRPNDDGGTDLVNTHGHKEWFQTCHAGLDAVATFCGSTLADLVARLCDDDPRVLASAYYDIGGYHGFDNFDQYPEQWTAHEFEQWPDRGEKLDATERDAFTRGYLTCALWANAMGYKHGDECPCNPDAGDKPDEDCTCDPSPELVSACDLGGPEPTPDDLTDDAREHMTREAHEFYADNVADIRASGLNMEQAGHDFSLTRNRHGAGFWDRKSRGPIADAALDRLTDAAHACGEESYLVGSDGTVSVMS